MKKTNSNISSSVSGTINISISVSPEDSETSENPKEAKNAEEPENPVNPSAPDTPNATSPDQNKKPGDEKPDPHKSFPYDDACTSLLAYSICQDSWRFALQKEREKAKMWTSIGIVVLLFFIAFETFQFCAADTSNIADTSNAAVTSNTTNTANAVDTSNAANKLSCPNGFIIALIGIGVAIAIYYFHEFRSREKWFKYNTEMLIQLSKPEINLIKCSSNTKEQMTNLINQYRYDKWMEGKKKKTLRGIIWQKIMSIFPFSIS